MPSLSLPVGSLCSLLAYFVASLLGLFATLSTLWGFFLACISLSVPRVGCPILFW